MIFVSESQAFVQSTFPQNRQLKIVKQIVKQQVSDFAGDLTFKNLLINFVCEEKVPATQG